MANIYHTKLYRAWLQTRVTSLYTSTDSGTTDGTTANKLVQSGQNFNTTVSPGNLVHNTTDDTFAYVTAVDSATTLSLDADIMVSGEAFIIYSIPSLSPTTLEKEFLMAELSLTVPQHNVSMWKQWLIAQGAVGNSTADLWYNYLGGLGYVGSLRQRQRQYWEAG